MQTIAANDMGCAFISCTAAFSFPGLGHAHCPVKASCEHWDERPQISRAGMQQCWQKPQLMCWMGPEQAIDISLDHSRGAV